MKVDAIRVKQADILITICQEFLFQIKTHAQPLSHTFLQKKKITPTCHPMYAKQEESN